MVKQEAINSKHMTYRVATIKNNRTLGFTQATSKERAIFNIKCRLNKWYMKSDTLKAIEVNMESV